MTSLKPFRIDKVNSPADLRRQSSEKEGHQDEVIAYLRSILHHLESGEVSKAKDISAPDNQISESDIPESSTNPKPVCDEATATLQLIGLNLASMVYSQTHKRTTVSLAMEELRESLKDSERAAQKILQSCESIEADIDSVSLILSEDEQEKVQSIGDKLTTIYESCYFQDILGQRINKVINTLAFIESTLESMEGIWGGAEEMQSIATSTKETISADISLLNGPALPGQDVQTQADIDKLFG